MKSIDIPDTVTSIEEYAFAYCENLESINLPNSITSINYRILYNCTNLLSVTIPKEVETICENAFAQCIKLQNILFNDKLKTIKEDAFYYCKSLEFAVIPDSVTSIESGAFLWCFNLLNVTISNNLKTLESSIFRNCHSLKSVTLPNNLMSIKGSSFSCCCNLTSITFPGSLELIESYSFSSCVNLKTVYFQGIKPPYANSDVFSECSDISFYVPANYDGDNFCSYNVIKSLPPVEIVTTNSATDEYKSSLFPSPTKTPYIDDTIRPNYFINEVCDLTGKSSSEIKIAIEEIFNKQTNIDNDSDIILNISLGDAKIVLDDLNLLPNQYIYINTNDQKSIEFKGGNLNLLLNGQTLGVTLNDHNSNMSIKNLDKSSTLEIHSNEDQKNITLSTNSDLLAPLTIVCDNNIEEVYIDSIDFHNSASILAKKQNDESISMKINTLNIAPQSFCSLKDDVTIIDKLVVSQTSVLDISSQVNLSNSVVNLVFYDYENIQVPMITGEFNNHPRKIIISQLNDDSSALSDQYIIFNGTFKTSCEEWKNVVDLSNSPFNDKLCIENNVAIQEEQSSLVLKRNNNTKNKLNTGQIAGIVIGCVAFIAIVVVVIVVLVKRKAKVQNSSENE